MDSPAAQRPEQLAYSPRARPAPRYQQRGDGRRVGREHDADEDQRWSPRRVLGELRKVEAVQVEGQKAKEEQGEHKRSPSDDRSVDARPGPRRSVHVSPPEL